MRTDPRDDKTYNTVSDPSASRIARYACAHGELVAMAAEAIVAAERARLPDLTGIIVALPGLHSAGDFARALRVAAGGAAVLLPRITTLHDWASQVPLERPVVSRSAREAMLYEALAGRRWLPGGDLWAVAGELAVFFDELTRGAVMLPSSVEAFSDAIEHAYRGRRGTALQFEARLVHELWHLTARDTAALDTEGAYQLRLAALAAEAAAPLYVVGVGRLTRPEAAFLERYATKAPVRVFEADPAGGGDSIAQALALAWPRKDDHPDLITRAKALREAHPASPLAGRVRYFGAASAEEEAQAIDVMVRQWLLEGRRRIAVIVNDRLTARRARALLERADVLVNDEAGWAFSTTSAATVIGRWLDVASGDAYYRDLLDLLKSPFVLHDWDRAVRQQAVWRLERYVRNASIVSGLPRFIAAAEENDDAAARQLLTRVQKGLARLAGRKRPLARWVDALEESLTEIGITGGLAADHAGEQLLDLLARLRDELSESRLSVLFADWRRWLARELEAASFVDRTIASPVVFTSLRAARLRAFDAVLIQGADAAHLPGPDPVTLFFNQNVRAELGLPTRIETLADIEADLSALIASTSAVLITWQHLQGGEKNLLSPQLERLGALHRLAYGAGLEDSGLAALLPACEVRREPAAPLPASSKPPGPSVPRELMPAAISASAYNALMTCPYQFHARYVLGLAEVDEVQELIEKGDYGSRVHEVLQRFHCEHPRVSDLSPESAADALLKMSRETFAADVARNYLAQAWLLRWEALIPQYVEWQRAREADGWRWHAGEAKRDIVITTPAGAKLRIYGRIDRIDIRDVRGEGSGVRGEGGAEEVAPPHSSPFTPYEFSVVDYKTQAVKPLREKLRLDGEDVQLPVYALLWGGPVAAALFLSVEREVNEVELDNVGELAAAASKRLAQIIDALHEGGRLHAQGIEAACGWCEVRGLCRRNYWP